MRHDEDYDEKRGCNQPNQNLMSRGQKQNTWSSCNVEDFKAWWKTRGYTCKEVKGESVFLSTSVMYFCQPSDG